MNWDDDSQKMWFMVEILWLSKFLNWSVLRSLAATSLEEIKLHLFYFTTASFSKPT